MARARTALAALAALWLAPSVAHAHGGNPQSQVLLFHPSDPDVMVVVATFGWTFTEDGGETWGWLCHEGIPGGRAGKAWPAVLTSGSALLSATPDGLTRGTGLGCAWDAPEPALEAFYTADVTAVPDDPAAALALGSDVGAPNRVFRLTADGDTSAPLAAALPAGYLPERIRVAPGDPSRIYTSGVLDDVDGRPAAVVRSEDGGASWITTPFVLEAGEGNLFLEGVDPGDPDVIYLRARGESHDRLVRSEDRGETFVDLAIFAAEPMPAGRPFGFTVGPDGAVWAGNTASGLLRIVEPGMEELVDKFLRVACLATHDGSIWVCADGLMDELSLGRLDPVTAEITDVMVFDQLGALRDCGGAEVEAACVEWQDDLLRDLGRAPPPGPDAGPSDAGVDAGAGDAGAGDAGVDASVGGGGGGCAVAAPRAVMPSGASALLAAALGAFGAARRRRRRVRPRA